MLGSRRLLRLVEGAVVATTEEIAVSRFVFLLITAGRSRIVVVAIVIVAR